MQTVIKQKTRQQTFNKVVAHLRKQNKRAMIRMDYGGTECQYLTEDGLKCAAGCLIPKADYKKSFEGKCCLTGSVAKVLRKNGYEPKFVKRLQSIHDAKKPSQWEKAFKDLAAAYELKYTPKEE